MKYEVEYIKKSRVVFEADSLEEAEYKASAVIEDEDIESNEEPGWVIWDGPTEVNEDDG